MSNPPTSNSANPGITGNPGNGNAAKLPPPTPIRSSSCSASQLSQGFSTPPSQSSSRFAAPPPPQPLFARPSVPASRSNTPAQTPALPRSSAALETPFMPPKKAAKRPATMPASHSASSSSSIPASSTASTRPVAPAAYGASASLSTDQDQFTTPAPVTTVTRPNWSTSGIISKSDRLVSRSKPPPTPARIFPAFKPLSAAPTPVAPRSRASTHGGGSIARIPLSESRLSNGGSSTAFGGSGFQSGAGGTPALFQVPRAPPSTAVRTSSTLSAAGRRASSSSLFASPATLPILPNILTRQYFLRAAARSNANSNASSALSATESFENALPYDDPPPDVLASTTTTTGTVPDYTSQHFRIDARLGRGSFSTVYHVTRLKDGRAFALKSLNNHYRGAVDRRCCLEEVWIWHVLAPHPRLVYLASAWEQAGKLHMCMELCPRGTLAEYLEARAVHVGRPSTEDEVWGYLADVGQALQWMHARGVAHLDVKPDNVYLTQLGGCKLGDFGLATFVGYDAGNPRPTDDEMRELVTEAGGVWDPQVHGLASVEALKFATRRSSDDRHGDVMYAPAESVDGVFSTKTDVFAYGLMALEMVTDAKMPSDGEGFEQLRTGVFTAFFP
ncbi:kinase-like domain-containing protein [Catenaria anguillulae PL171]|uniref:Kinase-like domain-containing protein n=1 Tax=Catenaria anguillulae PL171 TaxID=765915 RepID=A0A1Y2HYH7_9FUNG|nr:kinase-like domain-containing protein [Catenaria anguillulae PL171]